MKGFDRGDNFNNSLFNQNPNPADNKWVMQNLVLYFVVILKNSRFYKFITNWIFIGGDFEV